MCRCALGTPDRLTSTLRTFGGAGTKARKDGFEGRVQCADNAITRRWSSQLDNDRGLTTVNSHSDLPKQLLLTFGGWKNRIYLGLVLGRYADAG